MQNYSRHTYIFLLIFCAGLLLRVASFYWNQWPHGDIVDDRAAAVSFIHDGTLRIAPPSNEPFVYSLKEGRFLDQHPPLWSVAGAIITMASGGVISDPFVAFKILSFLSGAALILLLYVLAKKIINNEAALAITVFASGSYLLIDYSANGALYSFQAVLYICWVLAALPAVAESQGGKPVNECDTVSFRSSKSEGGCFGGFRRILFGFAGGEKQDATPTLCRSGASQKNERDLRQIFYFAVISAVGVMTNYQMVILVPATAIFLFVAKEGAWKQKIKMILLFTALFFVFISPIMVRNMRTFGSPWYSINFLYLYDKAGVPSTIENGIITYNLRVGEYALLLKQTVSYWLPYNFYYLNRKLFILAPVLFILFLYALIDYCFSRELFWKMFPVILLIVFHSFISIAWPIMKFRYFVPLLPFVFLIGVEFAYRAIPRSVYRYGVLGMSFLIVAWFSYATYRSVPTHTYYYDGAITTDPFGKQGESEWIRFVQGSGEMGAVPSND